MGQIKNIKLHIVTDIKAYRNKCRKHQVDKIYHVVMMVASVETVMIL